MYSLKTSDESSKDFEDIIEDVLNEFSESFSILASTTHTPPVCISIENGTFVNTPNLGFLSWKSFEAFGLSKEIYGWVKEAGIDNLKIDDPLGYGKYEEKPFKKILKIFYFVLNLI